LRNISRVQAINTQGGKMARICAASPEWSASDWYVGRNSAFIEQITKFANAKNDDMADCMSQSAVRYNRAAAHPIVEY
jgi:phage terminase large subunit-like protein